MPFAYVATPMGNGFPWSAAAGAKADIKGAFKIRNIFENCIAMNWKWKGLSSPTGRDIDCWPNMIWFLFDLCFWRQCGINETAIVLI